jgi:hypothetical protein
VALGTPTSPVGRAGGTTSCTTDSFTPTSNALLIAFIATRKSGGPPATPTISDSADLTWSEVSLLATDFSSSPDFTSRVMVALAPASPSSMTITANCTDSTGIGLCITEVTGGSTTVTNVATGTDTAGDPSATLGSAPAATSCVLSFAWKEDAANLWTEPTGFTELYDVQPQTVSGRMGVAYDNTSPTEGPHQWTSASNRAQTHLIEVTEGGTPLTTVSATMGHTGPTTPPNLRVNRVEPFGAETGHTATQPAAITQRHVVGVANASQGHTVVAPAQYSTIPIVSGTQGHTVAAPGLTTLANVFLGTSPEMGHTATQAGLGGLTLVTSPANAQVGVEVAAWELSAVPIGQWQVGTGDIPATASTSRYVLLQQNILDFEVSNGTQGHTVTTPDRLLVNAVQGVANVTLGHTADLATLIQIHALTAVVAEAGHTVAAPGFAANNVAMAVANADMGHAVIDFTQPNPGVGLDQNQAQGVADAEMGSISGVIALFTLANVTTPAFRTYVIPAESRIAA